MHIYMRCVLLFDYRKLLEIGFKLFYYNLNGCSGRKEHFLPKEMKECRIAWHPAFNGAIELELNENKDDLLFDDKANQKLYSRIRRDERMCQALMELMKDEIDEKVEQEVEKAKEKTEERITTVNLKNLMTSLNLTKEQAMDALMIPSEKRQVFMVNLREQ